MKKFLKVLAVVIAVPVLAFIGLLIWLTVTDYKPAGVVNLEVMNNPGVKVANGQQLSIMTWNIGYCGLGKNEDFFMDGGKKGKPDNIEVVQENLNAIKDVIKGNDIEFLMLQEIDVNSSRSFHINEQVALDDLMEKYSRAFALNYKVNFVPVPFPPMGKAVAGQGTYSSFDSSDAKRYVLPGEFSWPKKIVELDRCMIVTRMPVEGSSKELVLANAHFSAYDDGSIREKQLAFAKEFILAEYAKGNYVVLGGDWNQTFDIVDVSKFPMYKNGTYYNPISIPDTWLETGWTWGVGQNAPTYRLLNAPYVEGVTQTGIIDGFAVSPNIKMTKTEVLDLGFANSDHNPVKMTFELMK